jgi:sugar lactone lactonase YvrE
MFTTSRGHRRCAAAIAVVLGGVLATSASAAAQSPQVIRFDGGGFDRAAAVATDRDGNTFIGGSSESPASQNTFTVVKLGPDGSRRFTARYDGSRGGVGGSADAVAVDAAGNVYAAGYISDGVIFAANLDILVIKFAPDGKQEWAQRYDGPVRGRDTARAAVVDGAGNVYVTGSSAGNPSDWVTLKLTPDGRLQWERRLNGAETFSADEPADMALLPDGNVVVTGVTQNIGDQITNDGETIAYDPQGATVWRARFTDTAISHEILSDLDVDAAGRIAVTGTTALNASPELPVPPTPVTLRYDSRGTLLQRVPAGGNAIDVDPTGGFRVVAGSSLMTGEGPLVRAFDPAGNALWQTRLTLPSGDFMVVPKIAAASTGEVTVAGTVGGFGGGMSDYLTVGLASDGREVFRHRFDGPDEPGSPVGDEVAGLAIAAGDVPVVTGTSWNGSAFTGGTASDIVTLRFAAGATPPPSAPAAPSQLSATAQSRSAVQLRWQDNADNEDGFRIERCAGNTCTTFTQVAVVGRDATGFLDTGLARNTTYSYRVRGFNAAGASSFSNRATARTTHS